MKHKNTAYVFRGALTENYTAIDDILTDAFREGKCTKKPRIICVVKADAYGHGIAVAAGALGDAGCDHFAVSSEDEAVELRAIENTNHRHPEILILGHIMPENVGAMMAEDITCAVTSYENAEELSRAVALHNAAFGRSDVLKIHIKLDTGMNRVGFPTDERRRAETIEGITRIAADPCLKIRGIFTHFSSADDEMMCGRSVEGYENSGGYTRMQLERYRAVTEALERAGVDVGLRHCANSAAILRMPEAYFDAVRAGVIIYGLMPDGSIDHRFRPAMQFDSSVTHIHRIFPGDRVSYGATFSAESEMLIATVAAGYADGFERAYTGYCVRIGDAMYRQVGRICMDQFMVDITPPEGEECPVHVGDSVTLFGGDDGLMTDTLARLAGTINYEVVCKVSKRVPREIVV